MSASLFADADASHMGGGPVWVVISMVAFSMVLLSFAWTLLRPTKPQSPTPADVITERFARGEIDAQEFERSLRDVKADRD